MLDIGDQIDRYEIVDILGQGGMAAVYKGRHIHLGSYHAIKILFITAPRMNQRLLREGRVQARLRHPNIVAVTDVLLLNNTPALVMEFVDGPTLQEWLDEHDPSVADALAVFRGILAGVGAAHAAGVVHRDLKPANILLAPTNDGALAKVADFGLVKPSHWRTGMSKSGVAMGTPEFMAPEQVTNAAGVDERADLWALGCILYRLMCRQTPFSADQQVDILTAVQRGTYTSPRVLAPHLPDAVCATIDALLQVDPDRRLPSCEALFAALYDVAAGGELFHRRTPGPALSADDLREENGLQNLRERSHAPIEVLRITDPPPHSGEGRRPTLIPTHNNHTMDLTSFEERPPPRNESAVPLVFVVASVVLLGTILRLFTQPLTAPPPVLVVEAPPEQIQTLNPPPPAPVERPHPIREDPPTEPVPSAPVVVVSAPLPAEVEVRGEADAVWLHASGNRLSVPGTIPAGTYAIQAGFNGRTAAGAGELSVAAGERVTLQCASFTHTCRAVRTYEENPYEN